MRLALEVALHFVGSTAGIGGMIGRQPYAGLTLETPGLRGLLLRVALRNARAPVPRERRGVPQATATSAI
jgi:hypothetical protein